MGLAIATLSKVAGNSFRDKGKFMLLFASGAAGVVATLKSFVETTTGTEFKANQFPFYLGAGVVLVYASLGLGVMVAGAIVALASAGRANATESAEQVALFVGCAVAVVCGVALVNAGVIFDYDDTDAFGRFAIALLGVTVVGGGLWYFFKHDRSNAG